MNPPSHTWPADAVPAHAPHGTPAGAHGRAQRRAATVEVATSSDARRQWTSQQLLGGQQEVEITHAGSIYRLRLTSLGKLILTK